MNVNMNPDSSGTSGFYAVDFETFSQTLAESEIIHSFEMGNGILIHHGHREGASVWLMGNVKSELHGVWVEENGQLAN